MKVSDRQWAKGDRLQVVSTGNPASVVKGQEQDILCAFEGCNAWLNGDTDVILLSATEPAKTIEQRAVRLAEVYRTAHDTVVHSSIKSSSVTREVAHAIAMLLVKRELEAGDG